MLPANVVKNFLDEPLWKTNNMSPPAKFSHLNRFGFTSRTFEPKTRMLTLLRRLLNIMKPKLDSPVWSQRSELEDLQPKVDCEPTVHRRQRVLDRPNLGLCCHHRSGHEGLLFGPRRFPPVVVRGPEVRGGLLLLGGLHRGEVAPQSSQKKLAIGLHGEELVRHGSLPLKWREGWKSGEAGRSLGAMHVETIALKQKFQLESAEVSTAGTYSDQRLNPAAGSRCIHRPNKNNCDELGASSF